MANLSNKDGIYLARFRFGGKEYKRSLETTDERDARGAMHGIEAALDRLRKGGTVPAGVDPGEFIVSGGTLVAPSEPPKAAAPPRKVLSVRQLVSRYKKYEVQRAAETYYASQLTHLRHFRRFLGKVRYNGPADEITPRIVDRFLEKQLAGNDGGTVYKQSVTLKKLFAWAVEKRHLAASPAPQKFKVQYGSDRPPFRTIEEINELTERGGLSDQELLDLWNVCTCRRRKSPGLLDLVRRNADNPYSFLLHAIPAYTGRRRGEVLRLTWVDVDLRNGFITAMSRKQSRSQSETRRKIVLHDELLRVDLKQWRHKSSQGQFVLCHSRNTSKPLTPDFATRRFWQPMRGTSWRINPKEDWFKITSITYRVSFASNLTAANVSQAIVDAWMGHQSVTMRKRYQHLFPSDLRAAMQVFSLAAPQTT